MMAAAVWWRLLMICLGCARGLLLQARVWSLCSVQAVVYVMLHWFNANASTIQLDTYLLTIQLIQIMYIESLTKR